MLYLVCSFLYSTITIDPEGNFWRLEQLKREEIPEKRIRELADCRLTMENASAWLFLFATATAVSVAVIAFPESYVIFSFFFGSAIFVTAMTGVRRHSHLVVLPEAQQLAEQSVSDSPKRAQNPHIMCCVHSAVVLLAR